MKIFLEKIHIIKFTKIMLSLSVFYFLASCSYQFGFLGSIPFVDKLNGSRMFEAYIADPIPPQIHDIADATPHSALEFDTFVTFTVDNGYIPQQIGSWEIQETTANWYDDRLGDIKEKTQFVVYRQKDSNGDFITDPNNTLVINPSNGKGVLHLTTHF